MKSSTKNTIAKLIVLVFFESVRSTFDELDEFDKLAFKGYLMTKDRVSSEFISPDIVKRIKQWADHLINEVDAAAKIPGNNNEEQIIQFTETVLRFILSGRRLKECFGMLVEEFSLIFSIESIIENMAQGYRRFEREKLEKVDFSKLYDEMKIFDKEEISSLLSKHDFVLSFRDIIKNLH